MTAFTHLNLRDDVQDMAPKFGLGDVQEARFATNMLDSDQLGLAHVAMKPDQAPPFAHKHEHQDELYVVLSGSGTATLDDATIDLRPLDVIRVAPDTVRSFHSGPDGLEFLALGAPAISNGENDAELIKP